MLEKMDTTTVTAEQQLPAPPPPTINQHKERGCGWRRKDEVILQGWRTTDNEEYVDDRVECLRFLGGNGNEAYPREVDTVTTKVCVWCVLGHQLHLQGLVL